MYEIVSVCVRVCVCVCVCVKRGVGGMKCRCIENQRGKFLALSACKRLSFPGLCVCVLERMFV